MKQLIHLKSTIIPSVTGPIRYSPLARVFLLAAVLFACLPLSQTARAANPAPGTPATSASGGAINSVRNFSKTALLRPAPTITTFDVPGAGSGPGQGTLSFAINPAGTVTGRYVDASDVFHSFLRTRDGAIATFDAPGAGTGPGQGTTAFSINPAGTITGRYSDASDVLHGFLRTPDGAITTFDAPNAGTGPGQGTIVFAVDCLNPAGAIAAASLDESDVFHGVLRAPDGTMTTFDAPGAGTGPFQGTFTFGINQAGTIEGAYVDPSDVSHGFVRAKHGAITTFDVPGAGTNPGQGTIATCNNPVDAITGYYIDGNDVTHGFLRTP